MTDTSEGGTIAPEEVRHGPASTIHSRVQTPDGAASDGGPTPAAELARERGVPRNRLYKWQKEVAVHGGVFPGSGRQAEPAAELARLKRELARVTEERDIFKKAAAYFARESP